MSVPEFEPQTTRVLQHFMHESAALLRDDTVYAANIRKTILKSLQEGQEAKEDERQMLVRLQRLFCSVLHDHVDTFAARVALAMQEGELPAIPPEFRSRS